MSFHTSISVAKFSEKKANDIMFKYLVSSLNFMRCITRLRSRVVAQSTLQLKSNKDLICAHSKLYTCVAWLNLMHL